MNFRNVTFSTLFLISVLSSCVSKKIVKDEQARSSQLRNENSDLKEQLKTCTDRVSELGNANTRMENDFYSLRRENETLRSVNDRVLQQLENMSVISSSQAASIKTSLENIGSKDVYIQELQRLLTKKDSLNLVLVTNLKGAIGNMSDQDINIKVEKGVVFIDISDKVLFKTSSFEVTDRAREVLGKVAVVLKNQPGTEFMVEGHTDNMPFKGNAIINDNWDLSAKRATTIVKILQQEYGLDPSLMLATGRGQYKPIADNNTEEGRSRNRRTRIVIMPELDQFFKLLVRKNN
jgi:chemotaxis protein MotB